MSPRLTVTTGPSQGLQESPQLHWGRYHIWASPDVGFKQAQNTLTLDVRTDTAAARMTLDAESMVIEGDPYGRVPLYLAAEGEHWVLSTRLDEVAKLSLNPMPDPHWFVSRLCFAFPEPERTPLKGVRRVRVGEQIRLSGHGESSHRFVLRARWEPIQTPCQQRDDELRQALQDAVRDAMGASPWLSLSGGLDSSSLVALGARVRQDIDIVRLRFPGLQGDEGTWQRRVMGKVGLTDSLELNALEISRLRHGPSTLDELPLAPNERLTSEMAHAVIAAGGSELIVGHAGDAIIQHCVAAIFEAQRENRPLQAAMNGLAYGLRSYQETDSLPGRIRRAWSFSKRALRGESVKLRRVRPPRFMSAAAADLVAAIPATVGTTGVRGQQVWSPGTYIQAECHLRWRISERIGLPIRDPFMDERVIQAASRYHPQERFQRGLVRMPLRRAMRGYLPKRLLHRGGKANLTHGFVQSMILSEPQWKQDLSLLCHVEEWVDVSRLVDAIPSALRAADAAVLSFLQQALTMSRWLDALHRLRTAQAKDCTG